MSITILTPQATGLEENQNHLPALIQGEFVSNFSSYSAISVLDWERLDEIYLNLLSDKYDDKAREGVDLGNLAHTTHTMGGKIIKTPTGYNLQMSITRTADKVTVASFSGNFSFWELNNLTGIRRASLDLLQKVGVTLTAKAQQELAGAATENHVTAQNAFARGITAQRQGTEVAALSYYFQAAAIDPSLMEAVNRSSILNANIASGNIGDNVRNDIAWRRAWVERLTETERFFDNFNKIESMPYTLFYTNDIKQGAINYQNETVTMSIETYLYGSSIWTQSIERALQAVYDGLNATGRKDIWELGGWPQRGITDLNAFTRRGKNFSVEFELVNNQNKIIGKQILRAGGYWELGWGGGNRPIINVYAIDRKTLNFQEVNANDIDDRMTIRIASVNGTDAETAAINGALQIRTISADDVVINDIFRFAKGEILGFANNRITELVIPTTIWGDPVISIGNNAFNHAGITRVTIPNSIRSIGNEAFRYNKLAHVTIPNSVMFIGEAAFLDNNELTSVTIGANVEMKTNSFQHADGVYRFWSVYNRNDKKAGTYTYHIGRKVWRSEETQREIQVLKETQERETLEQRMNQPLRVGWRLAGGWNITPGGSGSEWLNVTYGRYEETGEAKWGGGAIFDAGLTLSIQITSMVSLAAEANYGFLTNNFWYGGENRKEDFFMKVKMSNNSINVPVLLRLGKNEGGYLETGFQLGFPFATDVSVGYGDNFPYERVESKYTDFNDFRAGLHQAVILGVGVRISDPITGKEAAMKVGYMGLRFIYHLTKWDRNGTLKSPFVIGIVYGADYR